MALTETSAEAGWPAVVGQALDVTTPGTAGVGIGGYVGLLAPGPGPGCPRSFSQLGGRCTGSSLGALVPGIGVDGASASGFGVYGFSTTNTGVQGQSQQGDAVQGKSQSNQHAGVSGLNEGTAGGYGVYAYCSNATGVAIYATGGKFAGQFDGVLQVNGAANITSTLTVDADIVMTAADCAEDFDLQGAGEVEPGTVMVLDEIGAVEPSRQIYDKKVAGVVSGAGSYRPGMILDRQDTTRKRVPLALVGKVFCKVDAQYGPVEVGDLLTTSLTPGHAMKASDPMRSFGAVLGKALQRLPEGCGLIPILVALQ